MLFPGTLLSIATSKHTVVTSTPPQLSRRIAALDGPGNLNAKQSRLRLPLSALYLSHISHEGTPTVTPAIIRHPCQSSAFTLEQILVGKELWTRLWQTVTFPFVEHYSDTTLRKGRTCGRLQAKFSRYSSGSFILRSFIFLPTPVAFCLAAICSCYVVWPLPALCTRGL